MNRLSYLKRSSVFFHVFPFQKSNQKVNRVLWHFFAYFQKTLSNLWNHIVDQVLSNGSRFFVQDLLLFSCQFLQIKLLLKLFFLVHIFLLFIFFIFLFLGFRNTFFILILGHRRLFNFLLKSQGTILKIRKTVTL